MRTYNFLLELKKPISEMNSGEQRLLRFIFDIRHKFDSSDPIAADDVEYLAAAFEKILCGENPKIALDLSGKQSSGRGRKTIKEIEETEIEAAWQVWRLHVEEGMKIIAATAQIAEDLNMSFDSIDKYYKKYRSQVVEDYEEVKKLREELQNI